MHSKGATCFARVPVGEIWLDPWGCALDLVDSRDPSVAETWTEVDDAIHKAFADGLRLSADSPHIWTLTLWRVTLLKAVLSPCAFVFDLRVTFSGGFKGKPEGAPFRGVHVGCFFWVPAISTHT